MSIEPMWWTPAAPPTRTRGLFSVANVVQAPDPHALAGVEYHTNRCGTWQTWGDLCDTASTATLNTPDTVTGFSFAVYDSIECSLGITPDEAAGMVRDGLAAKVEAAVEAKLQAHIKANGTDVSGTLGAQTDALALFEHLEYEAGQRYSHRPSLHVDLGASTSAASRNLLEYGDPLQTYNGTVVAAGRGYTRTANGAYFGAVTGLVNVILGPVILTETESIATRPRLVMGHQPVSVSVECVMDWAEV